ANGSWVENVAARVPVSDTVFFTPGNALSLKYKSVSNGTWQAQVNYSPGSHPFQPTADHVLTFKLFVASNTEVASLPRLLLKQKEEVSEPVDIGNYLADFQLNMWLNVQIPLRDIPGFDVAVPIDGV